MATSSRRCSDLGSHRSIYPAKAPQFFKFIDSGIVQHKRLRIPRKFMRKYGKDLSNHVFLEVPSGEVWQVEMIKCNSDVWLQNGWQEFTEHYSIGLWHFLVFRYEGNSRFHVLIFDMSASEIEYPFSINQSERKFETKGIKIEDHVESQEGFPTCQTTREKSPVGYLWPCKKTRYNSTCKERNLNGGRCVPKEESPRDAADGIQANRMKPVKLEEDFYSDYSMQEVKGGSGWMQSTTWKCPRFNLLDERKQMADTEKARALESAKAFKSENPFVIVTMQPSYISGKSLLNIPRMFVEEYLTKKHNNVILQVSDGRTWSVKYIFSGRNSKLSAGWIIFARDNSLAVGDVCVFELINRNENFLKVVIFRAANGTK